MTTKMISARELLAVADRLAARAARTEDRGLIMLTARVRSDLRIAAASLRVLASVCAGGVDIATGAGEADIEAPR
jgi:hypothetical protein